MTSDTTRGRPRDEERTAAILEATNDVLKRDGWDDLKVSAIAEEAGCGLATIYRRWATKEELVAEAMRVRAFPDIDASGDPVEDLRAFVTMMAEDLADMGPSLLGFFAATKNDPDLKAAFDETMVDEGRPLIRTYLAAVVGDDSPHLDMLVDTMIGAGILRAGLLEALSPEGFVDEFMALVTSL